MVVIGVPPGCTRRPTHTTTSGFVVAGRDSFVHGPGDRGRRDDQAHRAKHHHPDQEGRRVMSDVGSEDAQE